MIPPHISFKMANKLSHSSSAYNHNDKLINTIMTDITDNILLILMFFHSRSIIIMMLIGTLIIAVPD